MYISYKAVESVLPIDDLMFMPKASKLACNLSEDYIVAFQMSQRLTVLLTGISLRYSMQQQLYRIDYTAIAYYSCGLPRRASNQSKVSK